ncbi:MULTISPECIES: hypothetical protein [unclassified Microcoleus]|uniref:hypothetical protein n=1 Tax=unclassified Microcoleus TaxID=2642155 RepID=UPI002FD77A81
MKIEICKRLFHATSRSEIPSELLEGRSLFFYRRSTLINADAGRAIACLMNYGRAPFWSNMNDNDLN